jgi:hypothetical protein
MSNLDDDDVMFFREFVTPPKEGLHNVHPLKEGLHIVKSNPKVKKWKYDTTRKFQDS